MGGCASKPEESNIPDEAPVKLEKPQLETDAQDKTNGGESQIEKPLVDLSEPEKEAQRSSSEPEAVASEPVTTADAKVDVTDNTTVFPVNEAEANHNSNAASTKEEVKSDAPLISL